MMLWEILVPTEMVPDDGKGNILWNKPTRAIRTKHHQEWDKKVRAISGGLTILTPAKGQWIEPSSQELFSERMIPVRIACNKDQIQEIANFTIIHYRQKAVLFYKVTDEVKIMYKED